MLGSGRRQVAAKHARGRSPGAGRRGAGRRPGPVARGQVAGVAGVVSIPVHRIAKLAGNNLLSQS